MTLGSGPALRVRATLSSRPVQYLTCSPFQRVLSAAVAVMQSSEKIAPHSPSRPDTGVMIANPLGLALAKETPRRSSTEMLHSRLVFQALIA